MVVPKQDLRGKIAVASLEILNVFCDLLKAVVILFCKIPVNIKTIMFLFILKRLFFTATE